MATSGFVDIERVRTQLHFRSLTDPGSLERICTRIHLSAVLEGAEKPSAALLAALRLEELPDGTYRILL